MRPVGTPPPVLLFPAEDSLAVVRWRLEGICSAAGVGFQSGPTLRLDAPKDRERLSNTVQIHLSLLHQIALTISCTLGQL